MSISAEVRRAWIVNVVRELGSVRVADLAGRLRIPAVTVRRDIAALAAEGTLRRSHGVVSIPGDAGAETGAGREYVVGMLVPTVGSYFDEVIAGARAATAAAGVRLVLGISPYEARDDHAQAERLLESGVDGLLVAPNWLPGGRHDEYGWLDELPVPAVLVERWASPGGPGAALDAVGSDHHHGVLLALSHLASLGHRSVTLAARDDTWTSHQVRAGYTEAVRLLGFEPQPVIDMEASLPGSGRTDIETLADRIAGSVASGVRAVLVHNDHDAIQLLPLLRARGLTLPGGLALISYDDVYAALAVPALTAVAPPKRAVGDAAAELLLKRLDCDRARPARRIRLLPGLKVRGSCGGER
ncbi:substrate-binding domain-containing protein [Kitasatospora sp. NBC_00240]|uniref:substrate-binding domain-containing protein n=1 Tax=Kitasatospora sp. NBC_00240 TaxID=2903567 RepID=UPI002253389D|nr:substrate-binding domain-containing protein [Kitasatospora sp. NBC_00240]MCX5208359.1 substrate-binding domain-containing protein [Kitasatospora sp. NBC_00240]